MAKQTWKLDPQHTSINFSARHLMVARVHGVFHKWSGTLDFDPDSMTGGTEVSIDASSIDTKEPDRDKHLKSPDFLDVENHPNITFKSTKVEKKAKDEYALTGDLTIRGTTRSVTLDVEYAGRVKDPWGGERVGFSAKTSINRKEWGLEWNVALEAGGFLVSEKVDITIDVEAIKA